MRSRSQMAQASGQYKPAIPATLRSVELPSELVANLADVSVSLGQFDEFAHKMFGSETPSRHGITSARNLVSSYTIFLLEWTRFNVDFA